MLEANPSTAADGSAAGLASSPKRGDAVYACICWRLRTCEFEGLARNDHPACALNVADSGCAAHFHTNFRRLRAPT